MKLRLTRTGFDVGYGLRTGWHIQDLGPKGTLGEVSKIEEELLEYEDACAQNLFLLRAFELSDLIGALAAFLWQRNIPFDLAQPSERASKGAYLLSSLDFPSAVRQVLPLMKGYSDPEHLQDHLNHLQSLAETILILIFREAGTLGLRIPELLAQAQLRSAIAINGPTPPSDSGACSPPTTTPAGSPAPAGE